MGSGAGRTSFSGPDAPLTEGPGAMSRNDAVAGSDSHPSGASSVEPEKPCWEHCPTNGSIAPSIRTVFWSYDRFELVG